jgi:hypothetical protein
MGCVATGTLLDDADHQRVSATGGNKPLVLDFRDSAWQSRPETGAVRLRGTEGNAGQTDHHAGDLAAASTRRVARHHDRHGRQQ